MQVYPGTLGQPRASTWTENLALAAPLVMKLAGFGDYAPISSSPKSNSFMSAILTNGPPAIHSTSQRSFILRHREYLGDVTTGATAAFSSTDYPINPGLPATFPWLSTIAQNFEQYRIHGMVFEFKSTSADALNSTNTALGSVIMATEYNSDSEPFASKIQMENKEFASSARQSCSMLHPIECATDRTSVSELYVRTGDVPTGQDLRLYDLGRFTIATVGQQGASINIGELWCTYEVELLKPQIPDTTTLVGTDHIQTSTGVTTAAPLGSTRTTVMDGLGCEFTTTGFSFPADIVAGTYLLTMAYFGDGAASACTFPTIAVTNCERLAIWSAGSVARIVNTVSSTATSATWAIEVTSASASVSFSGGTLPTGTVQLDLLLTRMQETP